MPRWFLDFGLKLPNGEDPAQLISSDGATSGEDLAYADPVSDLSDPDLAEPELTASEHPTPTEELQEAAVQSPTPSSSRSASVASSRASSDCPEVTGPHDQPLKQGFDVRLPKSTLITPRGRYEGWVAPAPRAKERIALASLLEHRRAQIGRKSETEGFTEFELDKFSVYIDSGLYPCELRPLQHLSTKGPDQLFFDGVLSSGELSFYVERVPFGELPIGNYGTRFASVQDQIWIRSQANANANKEVYYKLKKPATEYERYLTPFMWIADLTKHVIDFCKYMTRKKKEVTLRHFQQEFLNWLRTIHKESPDFRHWHQSHGGADFRTAIATNVEFIWKEACSVLGHRSASSLQIFQGVKHLSQYRPFTDVLGDKRNPVQPSTIVTPYIYKCFGHTEFGELLEPLHPRVDVEHASSVNVPDFMTADEVNEAEAAVVQNMASDIPLAKKSRRRDLSATAALKQFIESIKPGDTISTPPDGAGTGTKWKKEVAKGSTDEHRWFGLVQKVHVSPKTEDHSFDVSWLYRPVDTPCCKMVYPWSNELFLSDHCTCEDGRDARVDEDEVLAVHSVDWFGSPETTTAEFFVRQTYQVEQRRWVTLERSHMTCTHDDKERVGYKPGDTVLAAISSKQDRAEAYEVVKVFKQGNNKFVRLRHLIRRSELARNMRDFDPRPNELVYTSKLVVMKPRRILGKCIIRFFGPNETLPCPYSRNGTANVFFITHKLENGTCVPLADYNRPPTLRQGFDPKQRVKKLRGLDLFCGSGNFGRGLEEGGVVDMCWTNDIWTEAIHTYMVNASHHTKPFLGSVDDLLRCAIEGKHSRGVPRIGEVDFISGGSPCQGFSLITADKTHDRQKKNRSLVASFGSFIDFYRPKYGILENVLNIVQTGRNREEDAFSQLICAIVGMGYQTQLTLGDAWTYGAPQSRSRAFIFFAAPGHRLPDPPRPSHSHFDGVKGRGLGKMTNGESFVSRSFDPTPFKFVSADEATADIPEIHDAKPDFCIGFPDHRISMGVTTKSRYQYNQIPIQPYSMNFAKTWKEGKGVMTPAERDLFPREGLRVSQASQGWGRINPTGVFHTITTTITPTDARTGRFLHWRESRPISILEARRAQGFPDHEVLVGPLTSQYELVGNSVARPMALALGLQFREAWLGSLYEDKAVPVSAAEEADPGLAELPMNDFDAEEDAEVLDPEDNEMKWEDESSSTSSSGDTHTEDQVSPEASPSHSIGSVPDGVSSRRGTPPTSVSESEAKVLLPPASRKRSLSRALGVELHAAKVRRVEAEGGQLNTHAIDVALSTAVVLEQEHVDLTIAGEPGAGPDATNGDVVAPSVSGLVSAGFRVRESHSC